MKIEGRRREELAIMKPYKLLTHTDMDGAACAILANIAYRGNTDITYINNPNDCTKKLI